MQSEMNKSQITRLNSDLNSTLESFETERLKQQKEIEELKNELKQMRERSKNKAIKNKLNKNVDCINNQSSIEVKYYRLFIIR